MSIVYILTSNISANLFGYYQLKSLVSSNHRTYLICGPGYLRKELYEILDDVYIVKSLQRNPSFLGDIKSAIKILTILKMIKPKLVIYSTPKAAFLSAITSNLIKVPVRVYQIWGSRWINFNSLHRQIYKLLEHYTISLSTNVTSVSISLANYYNMFSSKHIEVLGSGSTIGVDRNNFGLMENRLDKKSFITIGYLGRIANDKGISDLLEVFFALKYNNPSIKLQIIGELDRDDQISKPILNKLSEDSSIELLGPKSRHEIKNYVGAWSFQVFPSTREGLGNSILELAACGVPSVCWDIIGVKDAQPPHLKYLLIPLGRLDLLILEAEKLILNPITLTTKLAISNWVFDNFSQELVLNNFKMFIKKQLEINHEN